MGRTSLLAAGGIFEDVAIAAGVTDHGSLSTIMNRMVGEWAAEHDEALKAAQDALGQERYQQLLHDGSAMTYEQVIAWTRGAITARLAEERPE